MSHLLASVNQKAADEFDQGSAEAATLPRVGSLVEYRMRHGHGRQGRDRFPAFVMGKSNHGTGLDLLVFIDAGDFIDEQMVERARPGTEFHCWEPHEESVAAMRGIRATMASLHQRAGELEDRIKQMETVVLGDFNAPKVSIIHIMQDFENRLRVADANAGAAVDRAIERDSGPARRGAKPGKKRGKPAAKKRAGNKRK